MPMPFESCICHKEIMWEPEVLDDDAHCPLWHYEQEQEQEDE